MNKTIIFFLTLIILLLAGCKLNSNKTFKNDNIPSDIKIKIVQLDNHIIKAIKTNNLENLKHVFSDKLIEKVGQEKIDSIFNITNQILFDKDFKYKDQIYIENTTKNVSNTIFSGLTDDYDYIIHYQALNKKMFISMLLPKDTEDELLITLIYGLYGDEWKLNIFQFGQYSIFNKTAIDYLKNAQVDFENGYLIDAANNLFVGQQCLKPADQFLQYQKEKDFIDLQQKVMTKLNSTYTFPLTLDKVSTKPQIFNIHPQRIDLGNFPMIRYYSKLSLKDTINLKKENLEIQKVIGEVFKGIDKNKKFVFYWAFDELPDGTIKERKHYGFVQEIENE